MKLLRVGVVALLIAVAAGPAVAQESAFFNASDGVKIHYLTLGDTGSWVMLVHGYTDSANRMWFRTGIAAALAGHHRVVALDNRNHGKSDAPQPNGSGRAEDVIELMNHLDIDQAHIHGYSMGGRHHRSLAGLAPGAVHHGGFRGLRHQRDRPGAARAGGSPRPGGACANWRGGSRVLPAARTCRLADAGR